MMKTALNAGMHPAVFANYNRDDESIASSKASVKKSGDSVNYITFNQDSSCVAVGLSSGYKIFNCQPSFGKCYQYVRNEAVGLVEMLYNTSLVALVGLGEELGSAPRKLKIVNTKRNSTICDLVFPSTILKVKLSKKRLVVLLESQIYVYDILTMKLLHTIETSANTNGICAFSSSVNEQRSYLAYPSPPKTITHDSLIVNGINTNGGSNSVQSNIQSVSNSPNRVGDVIIFDTESLQPFSVIEAHKSTLAALALSNDGTLLATASDKGTIVRVFSVDTGVKLYQFRRGTYSTKIFSLSFSNDKKFVLGTTSSGSVHIFRLGEDESLESKHRRKKRRGVDHTVNSKDVIMEETEENLNEDQNPQHEEEDDDIRDDDIIRDDGDDSDADSDEAEVNAPADDDTIDLVPNKQRKLSQGSTNSFTSINSEEIPSASNGKTEPIIDQTRLSVARIIRRSSQTLGRKAAQKMGDFLPSRFSSILEPTRHFASIKINSLGKDVKSIAAMSNELQEDLVPQNYFNKDKDKEEVDPTKPELLHLNLLHVNVITSEGVSYTYGLDPERGGDCILLHAYSLLD